MSVFGIKKSAALAALAVVIKIAAQVGGEELGAILQIVGEAIIAMLIIGGYIEADTVRKALAKAKIKIQ